MENYANIDHNGRRINQLVSTVYASYIGCITQASVACNPISQLDMHIIFSKLQIYLFIYLFTKFYSAFSMTTRSKALYKVNDNTYIKEDT